MQGIHQHQLGLGRHVLGRGRKTPMEEIPVTPNSDSFWPLGVHTTGNPLHIGGIEEARIP